MGISVSVRCQVTAVVIGEPCMPARVELNYRADNAYAIVLAMKAQHGPHRNWHLDREMVKAGLSDAVGVDAAVCIRPLSPEWILLDLPGSGSVTLILIAAVDVAAFLVETTRMVSFGRESSTIDWDSELRQLGTQL